MSRAMEAARSAEHAKPPSAARTAASSRSRSPLTREPASPTPSGGPSGQARSWNGCSACRSMTSMRSCHGRFTNLTRSTSRFAFRRRVSSSRSASRRTSTEGSAAKPPASATGSASSKNSRGANSVTRHRIGTGKKPGVQGRVTRICGAPWKLRAIPRDVGNQGFQRLKAAAVNAAFLKRSTFSFPSFACRSAAVTARTMGHRTPHGVSTRIEFAQSAGRAWRLQSIKYFGKYSSEFRVVIGVGVE